MLDKGIVAFEEKERVTIMENTKYYVAGYLRLSKEDGDKEESDSNNQKHSLLRLKITERIIKTVKLMRAERGWK